MIRHARAAALAGAVLCAAGPALAGAADWWEVIKLPDGSEILTVMADAASAKTIAPGVVEVRFLNHHTAVDGATRRWSYNWVQFDCAHTQERLVRADFYDSTLALRARRDVDEAWGPVQPADPLILFVCKGERDGFVRREGFVPPVG
ncbi:hypothetical protein [Caulobacter sp. 17J65-9]|uniref:hypothetical protein n=1 Tax=Caulobacter sp. 17J65-9 TaxID=2709382 RepID=UPI0013C67850|nr:hypothetical protein [Caulobacter sp. 17J65-9]NEX94124.1 hypothetical protein [Caulobacter sp. 17J65-9]